MAEVEQRPGSGQLLDRWGQVGEVAGGPSLVHARSPTPRVVDCGRLVTSLPTRWPPRSGAAHLLARPAMARRRVYFHQPLSVLISPLHTAIPSSLAHSDKITGATAAVVDESHLSAGAGCATFLSPPSLIGTLTVTESRIAAAANSHLSPAHLSAPLTAHSLLLH